MSGGIKTSLAHPKICLEYIFYDPEFGRYTPPNLVLSTGMRALDHVIESQYHPDTTWVPCRLVALSAIKALFRLLPQYKADPENQDVLTGLFLAAYASLGLAGQNLQGGLGLSHSLGYALGSPYSILHGITSCLTLGHVVRLKTRQSPGNAENIAMVVPYLNGVRSGDNIKGSDWVADRISDLTDHLGFKTTLTEKGVGRDQTNIFCATALRRPNPDTSMPLYDQEQFKAVKELVQKLY